MCLEIYSKIKNNILSYLGYKDIIVDENINNIILECLDEIIRLTRFKAINQEFDYMLDFLSDNPYKKFLSGTNGYFITCYTLGVDVEKYIKKLRFTDLTKMCIADAVASSYLEYLSDLYDKSLGDNLSYRFCPGYQGTSVKDLKEIFKILNISSIGVELLDTYIMVPQKSMVGIIGIGGTKKKTCGNCMLKGKCQYILEGTKCYD